MTIDRLLNHGAIIAYTLAVGGYLAIRIFKRPDFLKFQVGLIYAGFALENAYIIERWIRSEHPPVFGTFENGLAAAWCIILISLVVARSRKIDLLYLMAPIAALFVLLFAHLFSHKIYPLTISEVSLWVDFHVTFAWLAFTSIIIAVSLSLLLLWPGLLKLSQFKPPSIPVLEDILVQHANYAFVSLTIAMASGSYYSLLVLGKWWRWDPVETLTLILWSSLTLTVHLKRSFGWHGRQLAWLILLGLVAAVGAYWLSVYFPPGATYHMFDIDWREHVILGQ